MPYILSALLWSGSFDGDNIFPLRLGLMLLLLINISVINSLWHKPSRHPPTRPARQFDSSPKAAFRLRVANTDVSMQSNNPRVVLVSLFCLSASPFFISCMHLSFFLQLLVDKVSHHHNHGFWWQLTDFRCTLVVWLICTFVLLFPLLKWTWLC